MSIVTGNKVLDLACLCLLQLVPTDEVVCQVVFGGIGGRAVHLWHGAIRVRLDAVGLSNGEELSS